MKEIVLVGYGGHGRSVADAMERAGIYRIAGYTDLQEDASAPYAYLGTDDSLKEIYERGISCAAIGVGYMGHGNLRDRLYERVASIGFELPVLADPSAIVAEHAVIGEGTFIGKNAVINADAQIGRMCIINTGAIIEHECRIGAFTHVAVAAAVCGQTKIAPHCFVGAGSIVIQNVKIEEGAFIGAGSTVTHDIPAGQRYITTGR